MPDRDDRGAVPRNQIPDTISGVMSLVEPRLAMLERVHTATSGYLATINDRTLETHALVRSMVGKLDDHIEHSNERGKSIERQVDEIKLARAREAGASENTEALKKAWIVPLGRAALGAVLLAGIAGLVVAFARPAVDAAALQKALQAIQAQSRPSP